MELHEPNCFTKTVGCSSKLREEAKSIINDIVGTGGMTCSGQYYASNFSGVKELEKYAEEGGVKVAISKKKK